MAEKLVEIEQQTDTDIKVKPTHNEAIVTKGKYEIRVESDVFALHRTTGAAASEDTSEDFAREAFENALDKAGRRIRGKYADVPTSSEEFAKRKQEEMELEERR
jgi:hypothetical protein